MSKSAPSYFLIKGNSKFEVVGDFQFEFSNIMYNPNNFNPEVKVTFEMCIETPSYSYLPYESSYSEDDMLEIIGEKLKQDFISFNKNAGMIKKKK